MQGLREPLTTMKLSTYRPSLISWLSDQIAIDSWVLDYPEEPGDTVGHVAPLRDVLYTVEGPNDVRMEASQDLYILRKVDGSLAYHAVDWDSIYGVYQTLALRLAHGYKDVNPEFSELTLERVAGPISILEQADERRDWVIQLHWAFTFTSTALPEVGALQPPFPVSQITTGLWRSPVNIPEITKGTSRLDWAAAFSQP